jgi:hypothetical protein
MRPVPSRSDEAQVVLQCAAVFHAYALEPVELGAVMATLRAMDAYMLDIGAALVLDAGETVIFPVT